MQQINALIDASSLALLALSPSPSIVSYLARSPMEMEAAYYINHPNYPKGLPMTSVHALPEYSWDGTARKIAPTDRDLLTPELAEKSHLAAAKSLALLEMSRAINRCRYQVWRELLLQETVYMTKKLQAEKFKDKKYPKKDILRYPYVMQYADLSGLSLKDAADEILFKAKLDDEMLAKTEYVRMKYFNLVRDVPTREATQKALEQFRLEICGCTLPTTEQERLRTTKAYQA
jgi:hypothetical protein